MYNDRWHGTNDTSYCGTDMYSLDFVCLEKKFLARKKYSSLFFFVKNKEAGDVKRSPTLKKIIQLGMCGEEQWTTYNDDYKSLSSKRQF